MSLPSQELCEEILWEADIDPGTIIGDNEDQDVLMMRQEAWSYLQACIMAALDDIEEELERIPNLKVVRDDGCDSEGDGGQH